MMSVLTISPYPSDNDEEIINSQPFPTDHLDSREDSEQDNQRANTIFSPCLHHERRSFGSHPEGGVKVGNQKITKLKGDKNACQLIAGTHAKIYERTCTTGRGKDRKPAALDKPSNPVSNTGCLINLGFKKGGPFLPIDAGACGVLG